MGQAIRLNNGGAIQVRTGVLQGIGPVGPRGLTGPVGPEGPMGPQGETGPIGGVANYATKVKINTAASITPDTDTMLSFGTVSHDDLNAATSNTNFSIPEAGDYQLNCWIKFNLPADAGDGIRAVWFVSNIQGMLARAQQIAVVDDATFVTLTWPDRFALNEVLNVYVRQSDNLAVSIDSGSLSMARIGAGMRGLTGPTGPQGPVGPVGPQGPQGPAGTAGSGYTTYDAVSA